MERPERERKHSMSWRITPDLLGVLSSSGLFEDTNPAWFTTLGWLPKEIESQPFFAFIHPDDIAKTETAFVEIQGGKPILKFENRYRHKDGSYRWLSWNAIPEDGRFFCNARDITAEKEREATLRTREEEARFREQFVAVLGHDLRNPVAAINAATRILRREQQSDKAVIVLDAVDGSVARMSRLIDDLMDFARSRLGSGISLRLRSDINLQPLLEQAIEEIEMACPGHVIKLSCALTTPIQCDPERIAQVLSNLLSNALTHGADGAPIQVSARIADDRFILSVKNAGAAIEPEAQDKLFQPFFRSEGRESQQGLGLGLFIVSEIARAHGGAVSVRSCAEATVFSLSMPVHQQ